MPGVRAVRVPISKVTVRVVKDVPTVLVAPVVAPLLIVAPVPTPVAVPMTEFDESLSNALSNAIVPPAVLWQYRVTTPAVVVDPACIAIFWLPVLEPVVSPPIKPEVNMYTTMPAMTAMAIRIKVAKIGEMALQFLRSLVIFLNFLSPLYSLFLDWYSIKVVA